MSDEGNMRRTISVPTVFTTAAPEDDHNDLSVERAYYIPSHLANLPRKNSLPVKTLSSVNMKNIVRRKSAAENTGHTVSSKDSLHPTGKSKKPSTESQEKHQHEFFIPEEYLEASRSPGSLREEIHQLKTIREEYDGFLDYAWSTFDNFNTKSHLKSY